MSWAMYRDILYKFSKLAAMKLEQEFGKSSPKKALKKSQAQSKLKHYSLGPEIDAVACIIYVSLHAFSFHLTCAVNISKDTL